MRLIQSPVVPVARTQACSFSREQRWHHFRSRFLNLPAASGNIKMG